MDAKGSPDYIAVPAVVYDDDKERAHLIWCLVTKYGVPTEISVKIHDVARSANISSEGARINRASINRLIARLKRRKA